MRLRVCGLAVVGVVVADCVAVVVRACGYGYRTYVLLFMVRARVLVEGSSPTNMPNIW